MSCAPYFLAFLGFLAIIFIGAAWLIATTPDTLTIKNHAEPGYDAEGHWVDESEWNQSKGDR